MPFFGGGGGGDYHIDVTNIKGGTNAGQSVTGSNNMLLGNGSGQSLLLSDDNVFVGNNAGNMLGSLSSSNIIIGVNALSFYNAQVTDSVLIGHLAGYESFNNNITRSVIVGERASPLSGSTDDVIIGMGAEAAGSGNVVIGQGNGSNQPRANGSDVSIGAGSIAFDGQGVVLGYGAQGSLKNVAIGYQAKADLARAMTLPAIAIGANVSALAGQIVIGDSSYTSVVIGGVTLSSATGSIFPSIIVGDAGTEETGINIGGVNYDALFKVSDITGADIAQSIIHRHSTTWEPIQVFARSNSNGSGHGAVVNGMLISSQYAAGWTDTEYNLFGRVSFQASATGIISDASSPGDFVIATTPDGATLPVEAVRVGSDKSLTTQGQINSKGLLISSNHSAGSPDAYLAWFGNNFSGGTYDIITNSVPPAIHGIGVVPSIQITSNVAGISTEYIHGIFGDDGNSRIATQVISLEIQQPTVNSTFTGTTAYGIKVASQDPGGKFGTVWGVYTSDAIFGQSLWTRQGEIYFGGNGITNARIKQNSTTLSLQRGDGGAYASVQTGILNIMAGSLGVNLTTVPTLSSGQGIDVNGSTLRLRTNRTIINSTDTGNAGEICWDANFIYVCVAANTWKRIGIATW